MFGTVTKYFRDKGYGFIRGEDGKSYFIHNSNLDDEYIESGYYVFFRPFVNDRSDYNAGDIREKVLESALKRVNKENVLLVEENKRLTEDLNK